MARKQGLVRIMIFIACIPFVGLVITEKEPNWLYYLSLSLILAGTAFIQYQNWKNGKQQEVKKRLITYAAILCGCIVLSLIMNN